MRLRFALVACNQTFWGGKIQPVPIFLPNATPYGRWQGLCAHCGKQVANLQLKYGLAWPKLCATLLHEMVHQYLVESGQEPDHNNWP